MIVTTELTPITCPNCAGIYAISKSYKQEASRLGGFKLCWTCPYCKTQRGYGKGKEDELQERIAELERSEKYQRQRKAEALAEAEHFRRSRDGMKGVVAKIKKRVGRGVCPCCNRHFTNLQRHMETKHPDVASGCALILENASVEARQ